MARLFLQTSQGLKGPELCPLRPHVEETGSRFGNPLLKGDLVFQIRLVLHRSNKRDHEGGLDHAPGAAAQHPRPPRPSRSNGRRSLARSTLRRSFRCLTRSRTCACGQGGRRVGAEGRRAVGALGEGRLGRPAPAGLKAVSERGDLRRGGLTCLAASSRSRRTSF